MKAARYHARGDIRVEDVPEPSVQGDEVKIRVLYAGICGSDLHEYYAGPVFTRAHEPHPLTGVMNPVILGHELCGEVVELGPSVEDLTPGKLVVVEPVETCGRCPRCHAGQRHRCEQRAIHGYTRAGGGFAAYTTARRSMVHALPRGLSAQQGALIEPMAVGLAAARRTQIEAGETVALHGAGPVGLGTALALKALGASTIVVDPSPIRRAAAERLGLGLTVDPGAADPVQAILDLTDGNGAAASVDAAGVPAALNAAVQSTAYDRNVVLVAVPLQPIVLAVTPFRRALIHLTASSGQQDFPATIAGMVRGDYPTDGWISTIRLEGIVEDGFESLHNRDKIKVLVDLTMDVG
jgi:(R,R)-butanediol dehydrogenase / meso-butanediol dehydrogenase / diacetyl reductase